MRFDDRVTGALKDFAPNAKIIHIDIDPAEIGKNVKTMVPIVGDVKTVLSRLLPHVAAGAARRLARAVRRHAREAPVDRHPGDGQDRCRST